MYIFRQGTIYHSKSFLNRKNSFVVNDPFLLNFRRCSSILLLPAFMSKPGILIGFCLEYVDLDKTDLLSSIGTLSGFNDFFNFLNGIGSIGKGKRGSLGTIGGSIGSNGSLGKSRDLRLLPRLAALDLVSLARLRIKCLENLTKGHILAPIVVGSFLTLNGKRRIQLLTTFDSYVPYVDVICKIVHRI